MLRCIPLMAAALALALPGRAGAQVERVWLTHQAADTSKLVVSWTSKAPGDSRVRFGPTKEYGQEVCVAGSRSLHHVEIPLPKPGTPLHYSVSSGDQASPDYTFKGYSTDVLRAAVVANWQGKPDLNSLVKDDPHLLLTAGDNVPDLWRDCGAGTKDCWKPYAALIDKYPELFRSVAFMPALGNHDREIRPRGSKPPADPVYDVDATSTAICSGDATMTESLVLGVLRRAIRERQPMAGLVHHTDRGGQYAGTEYRAVLRRASMKQSMSRADNCYDNAFMESCWSSIKRELEVTEYDSVAAARTVVAEYVRYYRFERKHSAIGYLTPHQFATRTMTQN